MYTKSGQFFIWTVIILGIGWLYFKWRKRKDKGLKIGELSPLIGPVWVVVFFLYGIIFNPPNNFAVMQEDGFLLYWFKTYKIHHYTEYFEIFGSLLIIFSILCLIIYLANKRYDFKSRNEPLLFVSIITWYLAAHCFRYFGDTVLDFAIHTANGNGLLDLFTAVSRYYSDFAVNALLPLGFGVTLSAIAIMFVIMGTDKTRKRRTGVLTTNLNQGYVNEQDQVKL
jgi:hypothetical protein